MAWIIIFLQGFSDDMFATCCLFNTVLSLSFSEFLCKSQNFCKRKLREYYKGQGHARPSVQLIQPTCLVCCHHWHICAFCFPPSLTKPLCFPWNIRMLHKSTHEHRLEPGVCSSRALALIMSHSDVFHWLPCMFLSYTTSKMIPRVSVVLSPNTREKGIS